MEDQLYESPSLAFNHLYPRLGAVYALYLCLEAVHALHLSLSLEAVRALHPSLGLGAVYALHLNLCLWSGNHHDSASPC